MRARPEFFAWGAERQEGYGVAVPPEDQARLDEALLAELFGRSYATRADATAAADSLTLDEQDVWNGVILPLQGIGEDCFSFNESFAAGQTILDFETLRDFDEADHRFQEEARKRDDAGYSGKPYRGSLYLAWARLFVDGRFTYATLSMAAGYLYAQLHEATEELLEQRIPHRYIPGKNHGKVEGECWQWDLRLDANGDEGVLEELKKRTWDYELNRWDELLTAYDVAHPPGVYVFDESNEPSGSLHVVFSDKDALSAVRLRSFLRDCRAIERPSSEIEKTLEMERAALARFIEEQHADVKRTYDPKVARFTKRRKVIVRKGAFD